MFTRALLSAAAVAVVGFTSCAGGERSAIRAPDEFCDGAGGRLPRIVTPAPTKPFLAMLALPNTAVILARLDPLSLKPISRRVLIGEYHDAWSLSPNRSQLAIGVSAPGRRGRIGIFIVDLDAMKITRSVETGVAAEAVAWLAPRRLVASLQREGTVLVDPVTGEILRRWRDLSSPAASAETRDGLVMLLSRPHDAKSQGTTAPTLVVIDRHGGLRRIALERIRLGVRFVDGVGYADDAGLAVDEARARAYVFAAAAPVAEVNLRTMRVSYHRVQPAFVTPGELGAESASRARQRTAIWLGAGRALVFGRDLTARNGGNIAARAAGATLVDTGTWKSCTLDRRAIGAALVADRVLVYGPAVSGNAPGAGLRAYTVDGRQAFRLFDEEQVWNVRGSAGHAYVRTPTAVRVVDARSGKIVSEIAPPRDLVDIVAP